MIRIIMPSKAIKLTLKVSKKTIAARLVNQLALPIPKLFYLMRESLWSAIHSAPTHAGDPLLLLRIANRTNNKTIS